MSWNQSEFGGLCVCAACSRGHFYQAEDALTLHEALLADILRISTSLVWLCHVLVPARQSMVLVFAGTWYAGVEGDDHSDCKYTITINKFDCPLNCSGRGTCLHAANGTRSCLCDQVG